MLSHSTSSCTLESPDRLLSCSVITVSLYITIILIIIHLSIPKLTQGDDDEAAVEFVVEQMRQHGIYSRSQTFDAIMERYANMGDAESAFFLLQEMQSSGQDMPPNRRSYNLALQVSPT